MHRIIDMKLNRPYILYIFICLWLLFLPSCTNHLWGKDFVVVIDAGHGGHDPGAIGKISKEKNINLNVALKVGNLIKRNCDDVKVIYTVAKISLFLWTDGRNCKQRKGGSLYFHSHQRTGKQPYSQRASTWTLGLAKSDANLEVAKRRTPLSSTKVIIKQDMPVSIRTLPNHILYLSSCRTNIWSRAYTWPR